MYFRKGFAARRGHMNCGQPSEVIGIMQDMKNEFFDKAKENLDAAQICFDGGLYNACANRAYYAALHAVIAALAHKGIKRDKIDHGQVQADFSAELINRRKIYPAKLKSYLPDMQIVRNQADYSGDNISRQRAGRWLARIKELVELINRELNR